jgi:zinc/manganese transport system substrate-binding protein
MRTARMICLTMALYCIGSAIDVQAKLNVVTTTADLASLAEIVGGERVTVFTLARPGEDPHFVDPKPSFIVRLNRADLLIEGGADLEQAWLLPLVQGARNPQILPDRPGYLRASSGIAMLEVPGVLDRSMGDLHAAGNPHFLMDPVNARTVAGTIAESYIRLDPDGSEIYGNQLRGFEERLDRKLEEWQRRLEPHRNRRLAAYHNIWPYFARRFGLRIDLFLEPRPGIPPTPASLSGVISEMKADDIQIILVEPFQNRRTAERVAAQTGAVVLDVAQYPGRLGGYIELIDHLVNAVATTLERSGDR